MFHQYFSFYFKVIIWRQLCLDLVIFNRQSIIWKHINLKEICEFYRRNGYFLIKGKQNGRIAPWGLVFPPLCWQNGDLSPTRIDKCLRVTLQQITNRKWKNTKSRKTTNNKWPILVKNGQMSTSDYSKNANDRGWFISHPVTRVSRTWTEFWRRGRTQVPSSI